MPAPLRGESARWRPANAYGVRHILFAVTQASTSSRCANRAETTLLDVRCHDGNAPKTASPRPRVTIQLLERRRGGLGWLSPSDCAPEFAMNYSPREIGVLPRLAHSRLAAMWWRC